MKKLKCLELRYSYHHFGILALVRASRARWMFGSLWGFHKNHAHRWTWRLCYVCINLNDMWQFQTWQYTWQYNGPACLCDIDLIEGHWCIGVLRLTSFEVFEKNPQDPSRIPTAPRFHQRSLRVSRRIWSSWRRNLRCKAWVVYVLVLD